MGSAAAAVRLGVRSRPSSRPSKVSILDGGPGGCPSGCPAVGSGASIPTACRAWKVQENSMSGRWRSARRRLAPTPDRGRLSAATSRSCSRPSRTHLQRIYHGSLGHSCTLANARVLSPEATATATYSIDGRKHHVQSECLGVVAHTPELPPDAAPDPVGCTCPSLSSDASSVSILSAHLPRDAMLSRWSAL